MTDEAPKPDGKNSREDQRRSRLASALRSNLHRRKAQVRSRDPDDTEDRRPSILGAPPETGSPKPSRRGRS